MRKTNGFVTVLSGKEMKYWEEISWLSYMNLIVKEFIFCSVTIFISVFLF